MELKDHSTAVAVCRLMLALALAIAGTFSVNADAVPSRAGDRPSTMPAARLSVPFVANRGQLDPRVAFAARTFAGTAFVTRDGALVLALPDRQFSDRHGGPRARGWSLVEVPVDAAPLMPGGLEASTTGVSVFTGSDRSRWHAHLPAFRSVRMGQPWPGVTYDVAAHSNNVERIFTVAPGASAGRIRMRVRGASALNVRDGVLVARTGNGEVSLSRPVAYQDIAGRRRPVPVSYVVAHGSYGFKLGHHDPALPVVIDPLLQSTYLGGSGDDFASSIRVASNGNVYIAGHTASADFPGTSGGAQSSLALGATNAFVSILSADLGSILQSTYLGGSQQESDVAIALGSDGRVYVVGDTESTDFPGATGCGPVGTGKGIFAAELDSTLTHLVGSGCFGGSAYDLTYAVATDASNHVYVGGNTTSTDFPVTAGAAQTSAASGGGFVMELNADLGSIAHATYLGSGTVRTLLVTAAGSVYAGGESASSGFPGPTAGSTNGYVALLQADLSAVVRAEFTGSYVTRALAEGSSGGVYASGKHQDVVGGTIYDNAYVQHFSADLLTVGTPVDVGGSGTDDPGGLAVATDGTVFVSGTTTSTDFPAAGGGEQSSNAGGTDGFIAHYSAGLNTLLGATYLGGAGSDKVAGMAIAPDGTLYAAGTTTSTDFPATKGAAQGANGGTFDAFIAHLDVDLGPLLMPTIVGLQDARIDYEGGVRETFTVQGTGQLTVIGSSSNPALVPDAKILSLPSCTTAGSCDVWVNAAKGQSGQATVTLTLSDRYGQHTSASFTLTVDPLKQPSFSGLKDVTVNLGQTVTGSFTVDGTGALTVTGASSNPSVLAESDLLSGTHCDMSTKPAKCSLSLTPSGATGRTTVTYTASDNYGQSTDGQFVLTVQAASTSSGGGSSGGGGGALGPWMLAALTLLAGFAVRRRARA